MSDLIKADALSVGFPTEDEFKQLGVMANVAIQSRLFKGATQKEATVAIMLKGRELQVPPIWSIERIHAIPSQGGINLSIDGQGMLALIRRDGTVHYHVKHDEKGSAVCTMRRDGDDEATVITWTSEDAKKAGLSGKGNWQKYEPAMLRWRAIADASRIVCPDIISGLYLADEVGAVTDSDGAPIYDREKNIVVDDDPFQDANEAEFKDIEGDPNDLPLEKVNAPKTLDDVLDETSAENAPDTPNATAYMCPHCDDVFDAEVALEAHIEANHDPVVEERKKKATGAKEEKPKEPFDEVKKMASNFHIIWSKRIKSLGTALDEKINVLVADSIMVEFVKKIVDEDIVDDKGDPHISSLTKSQISKLINTCKQPNLLDGLKRLHAQLTTGQPVDDLPNGGESPQGEEKPTKEAKVSNGGASKKVEEMQKALDSDYGMDGLKITLQIQKNHKMIANSKPSEEQLKACLADMAGAYRDLATGKSAEQVLKALK